MLQQDSQSFSRPVDFTTPARRLPSLLSGWLEITAFNRQEASFIVTLAARPACAPIALCLREQRIIESLLSGWSQKQIGYEFDLSPGTVSSAIRQILHKLGAACWEHLVAVACALGGAERSELDETCVESTEDASLEISATVRPGVLSKLTPAERDIALYVVGGCSNAQIARLRHTSVRTIANQISSLFRKLDVRGRLELILRMLVDEPAS